MRRFALTLAAALWMAPAAAQEAFCVDDADDKIGSYRIDLAKLPCPAGTTGVTLATIRASYSGELNQGGTWNAATSTYTPPAYLQPPTTTAGIMAQACRATDRAILALIREIRDRWSKAFPPIVTDAAIAALVQIRRGVRGVALQTNNADWTQARRLAFLRGSDNGDGIWTKVDDVLTPFVNAWELGTPLAIPAGRRLVWVHPETGAGFADFGAILGNFGDHSAGMVAAPADPNIWRKPGAWCSEIAG